jgi:acyl-CoA thioester hydrolase
LQSVIETHIGAIQTWECDVMGHLNVRFYVSRASEGLAILGHELGIDGGLRIQPLDHHIRFLRELRPGTPIRVFAGIAALRETSLQVYLEIRNAATDVPAATFIADTVLLDEAGDRVALPAAVADRARRLAVDIPAHGAPRGLTLAPPGPAPTLEHDRPTRNHLMGANRFFGQARCAARCGTSCKHRNAPEKPSCPTEGRVLLRCGRFARLIRCPTSHGDALIATAQNNPGQMTPSRSIML